MYIYLRILSKIVAYLLISNHVLCRSQSASIFCTNITICYYYFLLIAKYESKLIMLMIFIRRNFKCSLFAKKVSVKFEKQLHFIHWRAMCYSLAASPVYRARTIDIWSLSFVFDVYALMTKNAVRASTILKSSKKVSWKKEIEEGSFTISRITFMIVLNVLKKMFWCCLYHYLCLGLTIKWVGFILIYSFDTIMGT